MPEQTFRSWWTYWHCLGCFSGAILLGVAGGTLISQQLGFWLGLLPAMASIFSLGLVRQITVTEDALIEARRGQRGYLVKLTRAEVQRCNYYPLLARNRTLFAAALLIRSKHDYFHCVVVERWCWQQREDLYRALELWLARSGAPVSERAQRELARQAHRSA